MEFDNGNLLAVHLRQEHSLSGLPGSARLLRGQLIVHVPDAPSGSPAGSPTGPSAGPSASPPADPTPNLPLCYTCQKCGEIFYTSEILEKHLEYHTKYRAYYGTKVKCKLCDRFLTLAYIAKHVKDVHGNPKHKNLGYEQCPNCSKVFINKKQLSTYFRQAHGACQKCDKTFGSLDVLQKHIEWHTKKYRKYCRKKVKCKYCDKSFTSPYMLQHVKNVHENPKRANLDHEECPECGKLFVDNQQLLSHFTQVHGTGLDLLLKLAKLKQARLVNQAGPAPTLVPVASSIGSPLANSKQKWSKRHTCNQCQQSFYDEISLNYHMRIHNVGENTFKALKCQYCQMLLRDEDTLKLHMVQQNIRNMSCKYCSKGQFTDMELKEHIGSHRERKGRIVCLECGKLCRTLTKSRQHLGGDDNKDIEAKISVNTLLCISNRGNANISRNGELNADNQFAGMTDLNGSNKGDDDSEKILEGSQTAHGCEDNQNSVISNEDVVQRHETVATVDKITNTTTLGHGSWQSDLPSAILNLLDMYYNTPNTAIEETSRISKEIGDVHRSDVLKGNFGTEQTNEQKRACVIEIYDEQQNASDNSYSNQASQIDGHHSENTTTFLPASSQSEDARSGVIKKNGDNKNIFEKKHECCICKTIFHSVSCLNYHFGKMHGFYCGRCDMKFQAFKIFANHIKLEKCSKSKSSSRKSEKKDVCDGSIGFRKPWKWINNSRTSQISKM